MKRSLIALGLAAALMVSAPVAQAATLLATITHDYGTNPGKLTPVGDQRVNGNNVRIRDNDATPFQDAISFAGVANAGITQMMLLLDYRNASGASDPSESWFVQLMGSDISSESDDIFEMLDADLSEQTFTVTPGLDNALQDVFSTSVANEELAFSFQEFTDGNDRFNLRSATLKVWGVPAAVPLPAAGWLMLAGLGGLGVMRRRKRA